MLAQPSENLPARRLPFWRNEKFLFSLYALVTVGATVQQLALGHINNYYIFKYSFPHLVSHQNLFVWFPKEYYDNYKYGPVFAVLIAPISVLPDWLGVLAWTLLNAGLFVWALHRLPVPHGWRIFLYWFVLVEFLTATQNLQANPMLTAFIVLTFVSFERKQVFWAALFVALGGFVKIYGFIGGAFFLLYPQKGRFLAALAFWCAVLFLLPLPFVSFNELLFLYREWYVALADKTGYHHDTSLIQILQSLVYSRIPDMAVVGAGVVAFCTAYLRYDRFKSLRFRLLFLASVLIWMVIFSPGAESPTYVVAVTGVALWYLTGRRGGWRLALLVFVFVLTCLSPTDIFPRFLRDTYVIPYALKALPCVLVWLALMYELLVGDPLQRVAAVAKTRVRVE